jgi:hypothetical protein
VEDDQLQDLDGCDVAIGEEDATADEDLPMAEGGVAVEASEDDVDGCDVPIRDQDATLDEELPIAKGGVA